MKKVLVIVFMLSSCFLFFALLSVYQEKDESDLYHLFDLKDRTSVNIEFQGDLSGLPYDVLADDLYALVKESGSAVIAESSDYSTKTFDMYVAYDGTLNELFDTTGLSDVKFDGTEKEIHFCSDAISAYSFPMINKEFHVNIYSFDQLGVSSGNGYLSFGIYGKDAEKDAEVIIENYAQYQPVIQDYSQAEYDYVRERDHSIRYYLFISIVLLFVIMLFYLSDHMKNISIYRLNGYSTLRICTTVFGKTVFFMWAGGLILLIMLFVIFVGFLNERSLLFLKSMLWGYCLLSVSLVPVIVLPVFLMGRLRLSSLLKGRSFNGVLSLVMFVLCFPVVLYCTAGLIPKAEALIGYTGKYIQLLQNRQWYDETLCFTGYTKDYMHLSTNYMDMSNATDDPAYLDAIDMVNAFEEAGAWYVSASEMYVENDMTIPVLIINENCFFDTGVKLNAYDTVNEHLKKGNAVILMNTTLYETNPVFANMLFEGLDNTNPVILDPSFEGMSVFGDTRADIVVILNNCTPMRNKTIFNHMYVHDMSLETVNKILATQGMEDMVDISDMEGEYKLYKQGNITVMTTIMREGFPLVLLLVVSIAGYHVLYRNANIREIAVKRLFGFTSIRMYYSYLLECMLFYVCAGFFLQEWKVLLPMLFHLFLVWILLYVEGKRISVPEMLKGEET